MGRGIASGHLVEVERERNEDDIDQTDCEIDGIHAQRTIII